LEGFLGILVVLLEMRRGELFQSGFLGGVSRWERKDLSFKGSLIFVKKPPGTSSLILRFLNSGLSNEDEPFGGYSQKYVSLEPGSMDGRSGRMDGSDQDHLYFFSKKI